MTNPYLQGTINQQGVIPINLTTVDAAAVIISLGELNDGGSASVVLTGGGSQATDVSTNKYAVAASAVYSRSAGLVSPTSVSLAPVVTGVGPSITFLANAADGRMLLSIAAAVFPYTHRLVAQVIYF